MRSCLLAVVLAATTRASSFGEVLKGPCWEEVVSTIESTKNFDGQDLSIRPQTEAACLLFAPTETKLMAMALLECRLAERGRSDTGRISASQMTARSGCLQGPTLRPMSPAELESLVSSCLQKMDNYTYHLYVEHMNHIENLCFHVHSMLWQKNAESMISQLSQTAHQVSQQIGASADQVDHILKKQDVSLIQQEKIIKHSNELQYIIENGHHRVQSAFDDMKLQVELEHEKVLTLFSDITAGVQKLISFQSFLKVKVLDIQSLALYGFLIFITSYCTSSVKTASARGPMLLVWTLMLGVELVAARWSLEEEEQKLLIGLFRYVCVFVGAGIWVRSYVTYVDPYSKLLNDVQSHMYHLEHKMDRYMKCHRMTPPGAAGGGGGGGGVYMESSIVSRRKCIDPVTKDVLLNAELGPLCLASFEALRTGLGTLEAAGGVSSSSKTAGAYLILVVTTFSGLQDWRRCCVCAASACPGGDQCPNLKYCLGNNAAGETASCSDRFIFKNNGKQRTINVVVTTYGSLNAAAERFKRQEWTAVVLEHSLTIPFPHSYTVRNLHSLTCRQWYTVNHAQQRCSRFTTSWQELHMEALGLQGGNLPAREQVMTPSRRAHTAGSKRQSIMVCDDVAAFSSPVSPQNEASPNVSNKQSPTMLGAFWSFMEPGVGSDAGSESLRSTRSLLEFLAAWKPSKMNENVKMSCPVLYNGIWYIRAEPCDSDRAVLRIAARNVPPKCHERLFTEYFQTTYCPIDYATLSCLICGSSSADALMTCCESVFHRDCLLYELLTTPKPACPKCHLTMETTSGLRPNDEEGLMKIEEILLEPDSYCIVDIARGVGRIHDWTCQLTRQVITSAIQNHMKSWLTMINYGSKVVCSTARVHNGEALSSKLFKETRELLVYDPVQTHAPASSTLFPPGPSTSLFGGFPSSSVFPSSINSIASTEDTSAPTSTSQELDNIYIFFVTKGTPIDLKPPPDKTSYIVITLVAGIYDYVKPVLDDSTVTPLYKLI